MENSNSFARSRSSSSVRSCSPETSSYFYQESPKEDHLIGTEVKIISEYIGCNSKFVGKKLVIIKVGYSFYILDLKYLDGTDNMIPKHHVIVGESNVGSEDIMEPGTDDIFTRGKFVQIKEKFRDNYDGSFFVLGSVSRENLIARGTSGRWYSIPKNHVMKFAPSHGPKTFVEVDKPIETKNTFSKKKGFPMIPGIHDADSKKYQAIW